MIDFLISRKKTAHDHNFNNHPFISWRSGGAWKANEFPREPMPSDARKNKPGKHYSQACEKVHDYKLIAAGRHSNDS
jgi:hypothetical protein